MAEREQWRSVVGYEGWYEVSNHGRVRRMKSYRSTFVGRILKLGINRGYLRVVLSRGGSIKGARVHQLVTAAFIGPCPDGKEVNHIDGDKTNNYVSNLEYLTPSENHRHAYRIGTHLPTRVYGRKNPRNQRILTEEEVLSIRNRIGRETQKSIGESFGVCRSTISKIATGRSWGWL